MEGHWPQWIVFSQERRVAPAAQRHSLGRGVWNPNKRELGTSDLVPLPAEFVEKEFT